MAWSGRPAFSSFSASCLSLTGLTLATATSEQPPLRAVEGAPVDRGGAQPAQRVPMVLAGVTHVTRQPVAGVALVALAHERVAFHLGHHGGGGDREAQRVALYDGPLLDADAGH